MSGLAADWLDVSPFLHGWWLIVIVFNKLNKNLFYFCECDFIVAICMCASYSMQLSTHPVGPPTLVEINMKLLENKGLLQSDKFLPPL